MTRTDTISFLTVLFCLGFAVFGSLLVVRSESRALSFEHGYRSCSDTLNDAVHIMSKRQKWALAGKLLQKDHN